MIRHILLISLLFCFVACKKAKPELPLNTTQDTISKLESAYINGDSIHYLDVGNGEPIVFVHGGLGDYRSWSQQMDTFSTKYRVIAYSRRYAYPNTQVINDSADYTVLPHVKDMAALINSLDLGPVHLVGHSWGAFTALKTTIDHPELIKSLTLGEPPVQSIIKNTQIGDSLIDYIYENAFKPSARAFKNGDNENGIRYFIGGVMGDSLIFDKVPETFRNRWLKNTLGLRGHVINRSFITIPSDDIKTISIPVLIIKGEKSPLYFGEIANKLHTLIPNSQLFILPNSSHGLQGSNPKVFNQKVLEFINRN